jgi:hypothetical protein
MARATQRPMPALGEPDWLIGAALGRTPRRDR